ncbi:MAG: hypothetical protein JO011_10870 [Ktedonobacteraceae bacterium]|nr:hypothetical protein [Ktedonobacteraceae bacterium]
MDGAPGSIGRDKSGPYQNCIHIHFFNHMIAPIVLKENASRQGSGKLDFFQNEFPGEDVKGEEKTDLKEVYL